MQLVVRSVGAATSAVLVLATLGGASPHYRHERTRELVGFVQSAAGEVEASGTDAFPLFRKEGGSWFTGERYIFVWGLDGLRHVYPPDPTGEGKNMLGLLDIEGKPIGLLFVETARSVSGSGWVHYKWPPPGEERPLWKSTYIQRAIAPSGTAYLLGSGDYEMPTEAAFVTALVERAAGLLANQGREGLAQLISCRREYRFEDTYLFVKDMEGTELVNVAFPSLVGRNLFDLADSHGKRFVQEVIERLRQEEDCWVEYYWPRPGKRAPEKKRAYEKRVKLPGGEVLIVGAGYFPEA